MLFSIIVPVYNVEKYLNECVESILSQTHKDFELILINDGSTDTSGNICDQYAQNDNRVKVIHKQNGGQSTARNLGVKNAIGEYAIFLDSDDFINDENFLFDLKEKIKKNTDIIVFRYHKYYSDHIDDCGISLKGLNVTEKNIFIQQLVSRDAFFCSCWSKCTRMSILKDNNITFDENLCCEDMDWYYNVVSHAKNFEFIDKPYINYRQRENSVTSTFKKKSFTDYIFTINKWQNEFQKIADSSLKVTMLSSLAKLYCNLLIGYSAHSKQLKTEKKQIFAFKKLLKYNLNPRTKIISRFAKIFGLNITCFILKILQKVR